MKYDGDSKITVTVTFPTAIILTIVFLVLKLCNMIDWNWMWILSPLWISVALDIIIITISGLIIALNNKDDSE